jgi:hypothetical protein
MDESVGMTTWGRRTNEKREWARDGNAEERK